jgi:hypothetical protein
MENKFMKIGGVVLMIASLLGAAWAFDKKYMPREVAELLVADLQKNQMQIQQNIQVGQAQQWLFYWQMQVTQLTGACAAAPWDDAKKQQLIKATQERDKWQRQVNRLMQKQ